MSENLIELKGLKKYFKTKNGLLHAVDDINVKIKKGKTLGVVGESGCGKTTLGRTILGVLPATDGQILYKGKDITKLTSNQRRKIWRELQLIFQDPFLSINPRHTVSQIIAEPLIVNKKCKTKKDREQKILQLMETVGLADRFYYSYPHELDGGRRQRIGIARAIALDPEFIVCDEPVSALDISIQAQILNLMMQIQEKKELTYLFITHDLSVVRHISNEIMVMYLGQCVEKAPAKQLFINPKHPYTKALLSAIPIPSAEAREVKTQIIRGELTNPINPKPGCRFAARCPIACEECKKENIPLREIKPEHLVACIKAE